jgi:putative transposase
MGTFPEGVWAQGPVELPKTSPTQLTAAELATMKEMVTSKEYRHMPITTLARFAQRTRRVFASVSTWSKKVRERGWRRPRNRLYPAKPKVGIRASKANEYWHLDVSVIRLLDGTKVFLHGVIDNFSRRILAWRICERMNPATTVAILREAAVGIGITPKLVTDSGVENINGEVDGLVEAGVITRILALVEVSYSNSIIEAYWRSLKHEWLFLNSLDNLPTLEKLVAFHVQQHNGVMPHSAFRGQTPDEVYFGTGASVTGELAASRARARRERLVANRALSCSTCEPESPVKSATLQLRQRES